MYGLSQLKKRLERLESKAIKRQLPMVSFRIYDKVDIIGFNCGRAGQLQVQREPGETVEALEDRAFAMEGTTMIAALYAPEAAEAVSEPQPTQPPANAHEGPQGAFALAGIGREATYEEKLRSGFYNFPAERLID